MRSHRTEMCRATDGQGGSCTLIADHHGDCQFFNWSRFLEPPIYVPQNYILAAHAALDAIEAEAAFGREWVWFSRERWEALKAAVLGLAPGLEKDDTRANERTERRSCRPAAAGGQIIGKGGHEARRGNDAETPGGRARQVAAPTHREEE